METDNTWDIMCLIDDFNRATETIMNTCSMDTCSKEYEKLEELYAQAMRIQCASANAYGHIMVAKDFYACVNCGSFIDYDGSGVFLDWDGNECDPVRCDTDYLDKFSYPFVAWFNK